MKTICYIIPYFGKLPKNFALYLLGCAQNPTIDWKILTDDRTPYEFPTNVHVKYCNYEEVKQRIKAWFDFETGLTGRGDYRFSSRHMEKSSQKNFPDMISGDIATLI